MIARDMYRDIEGLCMAIVKEHAQYSGVGALSMPTEIKTLGFKTGNGLVTSANPQLRSALLMAWSRHRNKSPSGCHVVLKLDSRSI